MYINQAYKFKLKTDSEMESVFDGYLGCSRFVWNKALALIKSRLENKNIEKVVRKKQGFKLENNRIFLPKIDG
jgi:hypothetical protein